MWKLAHNALAVDANVIRLGIPIVSKCICCSRPLVESLPHLFWSGDLAKQVWQFFETMKLVYKVYLAMFILYKVCLTNGFQLVISEIKWVFLSVFFLFVCAGKCGERETHVYFLVINYLVVLLEKFFLMS